MEIIKFSDISPDKLQELVSKVTSEFLIKNSILPPTSIYPNISWWFDKVKKEAKINNFSREIFLSVDYVEKDIKIIAILICKNTELEKKICTIRVAENYRRQGIGSKLFKEAFRYLGTQLPLITVSEEFKDTMEPFLRKYKFKNSRVVHDMYRSGKKEYIYNE